MRYIQDILQFDLN